jgi:hypothetical protein
MVPALDMNTSSTWSSSERRTKFRGNSFESSMKQLRQSQRSGTFHHLLVVVVVVVAIVTTDVVVGASTVLVVVVVVVE